MYVRWFKKAGKSKMLNTTKESNEIMTKICWTWHKNLLEVTSDLNKVVLGVVKYKRHYRKTEQGI